LPNQFALMRGWGAQQVDRLHARGGRSSARAGAPASTGSVELDNIFAVALSASLRWPRSSTSQRSPSTSRPPPRAE
jgi:hypothetical protein